MNLREYKCTKIPSVKTLKASESEEINFEDLINMIAEGNTAVDKARECLINGDSDGYKGYKSTLPVFLPYRLSDRSESGAFTNHNRVWDDVFLMMFDVDHLGSDACDELKPALIEVEGVAAVFKTPSGEGLRIITFVQKLDCTYTEFYTKAANYFDDYFGIPCDLACGNTGRKSFISSDPDLEVNYDCGLFNHTINAAQIILKNRKANSNNKSKNKGEEGQIPLIYLTRAGQFRNARTAEEATEFVEFVLKDLNFQNKDGSGRHQTLFYHLVLTGLRLGMPPLELEKGVRTGFSNIIGAEIKSWLRSKNLRQMIQDCHDRYCSDIVSIHESSLDFEPEFNKTLHVEQFLSEKKEELTKVFEGAKKLLLKAPTGSGKSTFIYQHCLELFEKNSIDNTCLDCSGGGHILITQPNVLPTERAYYELTNDPNIPQWVKDQIVLVTGDSKIEKSKANLSSPCVFLAVIDQLDTIIETMTKYAPPHLRSLPPAELLPKLFSLVVIDEMHKIESDSTFRDSMVSVTKLFLPQVKLAMVTATPTFGLLKMCKDGNYTTCLVKAKRLQKVNLFKQDVFTYNIILEKILEECQKKGKKVLARIGLKADIRHLKKDLEKKGVSVLVVTADSKNSRAVKQFIKTGETKATVILCTKVFEDGISIKIPGEFSIIYNTNQMEIADERAIKQLTARCRNSNEIDAYLFLSKANLPIRSLRKDKKDVVRNVQEFITMINSRLSTTLEYSNEHTFEVKTICKLYETGFTGKDEINVPKILNSISHLALCFDHLNGLFESNLRNIFGSMITKIGEEISDEEAAEFKEYKVERATVTKNEFLDVVKILTCEKVFALCYRINKHRMKLKGSLLLGEQVGKMKEADAVLKLSELGYGEELFENVYTKKILNHYDKIFRNLKGHIDKLKIIFELVLSRKVGDFQERLTYVLHMNKRLHFNNRFKPEDFKYDLSIYRDIEDYVNDNNGVFRINEFYKSAKEKQNFKIAEINHVQDIQRCFSRLFNFDMVRRRITINGKTERVTEYINCIPKNPIDLLTFYGLTKDMVTELLDYEENDECYEKLERECRSVQNDDLTLIDADALALVKQKLDFD